MDLSSKFTVSGVQYTTNFSGGTYPAQCLPPDAVITSNWGRPAQFVGAGSQWQAPQEIPVVGGVLVGNHHSTRVPDVRK